jgi:ketosteroid isomerase-like protein
VTDLDKSIERVLGTYAAAVHAKDVEAFMRLYDPAARIFDAWGVWSYEGAAAWRIAVEGWLMSLGSERVRVSFEDVGTIEGRDVAVVSAIVTYAGISAQGEELRAMQNRITWALRTTGHVMRIVHEHTSAPIDFDESKAILRRAK